MEPIESHCCCCFRVRVGLIIISILSVIGYISPAIYSNDWIVINIAAGLLIAFYIAAIIGTLWRNVKMMKVMYILATIRLILDVLLALGILYYFYDSYQDAAAEKMAKNDALGITTKKPTEATKNTIVVLGIIGAALFFLMFISTSFISYILIKRVYKYYVQCEEFQSTNGRELEAMHQKA